MATATEPTNSIDNIGAIVHVSIPAPEEGGIVVFKGENGSGKSTALRTIESTLGRKSKLTVRDGEAKGSASFGGIKLTLGTRMGLTGEAVVTSLEGKLDITDLVDPGLKDEVAADAKRIRALLSLSGAKADPELFFELFGGEDEFNAICPDVSEADDLVDLAATVKRKAEAESRRIEAQAEKKAQAAATQRQMAGEVGPEANDDPNELQADLEACLSLLTKLHEQQAAAVKAASLNQQAQRELDLIKSTDGPTYTELNKLADTAGEESRATFTALDHCRKALQQAEHEHKQALSAFQLARAKADAKVKEDGLTLKWQQQLSAAVPSAPDASELAAARQDVDACRKAIETAAVARAAKAKLTAAEAIQAEANELTAQALRLRNAAVATENVLSEAVAKLGCSLRVYGGRLVTKTKRKEQTLFSDLSHGERYKQAIPIVAHVLKDEPRPVVTLEQEAFEALDPANRDYVRGLFLEHGILCYTALAADGPLRAEVYNGNGEHE